MENKKRLIYAEDLFEPVDFTVLQVRKGGPGGGKTMAMYEQLFRKRVELAPTIDAEVVVRCKNCVSSTYNECSGLRRCTSQRGLNRIVDDGEFCSWGEREESDHV